MWTVPRLSPLRRTASICSTSGRPATNRHPPHRRARGLAGRRGDRRQRPQLIEAAESGLEIRTATGTLNLADDDAGIFVARQLVTMAAHEAAQTSKRRKAKLRHDAESGRPHWARRPFGFELTGEHVPAEADMLREIYARIIDGESATAVARWLNESEVPTASGAEWQAATVTFLVKAERNAGKRAYKGEVVGDGSWQPIVDEQTWRDGCAALAARSRPRKGGSVSLLTGLVECGASGGTVYRTGAGRRAEYRCIHRQDGRKVSGCGNSMIAYRVDEHLTGLVLAFVGDVEPKSNQRRSTDAPADVVQMRADRWPDLDVGLRNRIVSTVIEKVTIGASTQRRLDLGRIGLVWRD